MWDAQRADGVLPDHGDDRRVRPHAYRADGIRYWDAIDPDLFNPPTPRTGDAVRALRVGRRPTSGWRARSTCPPAARSCRSGSTATPSSTGTTSSSRRTPRRRRLDDAARPQRPHEPGHRLLLPVLAPAAPVPRALPDRERPTARATRPARPARGTRQRRRATATSSGRSTSRAYAGSGVEVSISYASDDTVQLSGVVRRRHRGLGAARARRRSRTTATRSTAGPCRARPRAASPTRTTGSSARPPTRPRTAGDDRAAALARQPEIIGFLVGHLRAVPVLGRGRDRRRRRGLGFALENQTRPIYARGFFENRADPRRRHRRRPRARPPVDRRQPGLAGWQHIWLNEGFATYTEWLWSEREGRGTAQEIFDSSRRHPGRRPVLGADDRRPGPDHLFDGAVYDRGAMTLHALRLKIGDERVLPAAERWVRANAGGNVTTQQFIALAERISGRTSTTSSRPGCSRLRSRPPELRPGSPQAPEYARSS